MNRNVLCFVEIWSHVLTWLSLSFDLQVHFKVTLHLEVTLNFLTCVCAAVKMLSRRRCSKSINVESSNVKFSAAY